VTGVNWRVKLLNVAGTLYEDEIIAGYEYVGNLRRRYNQTNGQQGAFVVATNASFGLDKEFAEDHPLWCAVYDSLGQLGIVSVGATTNDNRNVEIEGDMPSTCTSEFLITVTNIDQLGAKVANTGYGKVSIDLGAPGQNTYSTANVGNATPGYAPLGGTSAATPHVTGAVGLLYSMPCPTFSSDALTDPVACARRVRDAIVLNTEPNDDLDGITVTGGHLDLARATAFIQELCQGSSGPLAITKVRQFGDDLWRVSYQTPNDQPYAFRVHNMLGQLMYEETLTANPFSENYVTVDGANFPPGIYTMSIRRGDAVVSRKFRKI
jgi:hypothetical protein